MAKNTYIFDSFLEDLAENPANVFSADEQRRWLKIDLMTARDDWQSLFKEYDLKKCGDVYYFKMQINESYIEYYIHEIQSGLLMFFSLSKREEYNSTLKSFVKRTPGITQMWFSYKSFDSIIKFIETKYDANIYSFTARRAWASKYPAKIRAGINRIISYTGDDADDSLKELREIYGVLPTLIDFQINSDKIRITNDGFFLIRNINRTILRIIEEVIDSAIAEPRRLCNISKQIICEPQKDEWNNFKTSKLMSGKIDFNIPLTNLLINQLFNNFKDDEIGRTEEGIELPNFSFIDKNISDNSTHYSATVVDEDKGTIFGISVSKNTLILVPKHRTTFESFINFYRLVNEVIDESSNLCLFNENNAK